MKKIPNGVISISSIDSFNTLVNLYKENLILVDFYADWCQPCKSFKPVYEKTQKQYYDRGVIFARLNTEHLPEVARQFNGKVVDETPEDNVVKQIEELAKQKLGVAATATKEQIQSVIQERTGLAYIDTNLDNILEKLKSM